MTGCAIYIWENDSKALVSYVGKKHGRKNLSHSIYHTHNGKSQIQKCFILQVYSNYFSCIK
jgi:hypothetical protein